MPRPPGPVGPDDPWRNPGSALGPADPVAVARAAEILRDRTMSFEEVEPHRIRPIVVVLMVLTVALAGLAVVFRKHVMWVMGLV